MVLYVCIVLLLFVLVAIVSPVLLYLAFAVFIVRFVWYYTGTKNCLFVPGRRHDFVETPYGRAHYWHVAPPDTTSKGKLTSTAHTLVVMVAGISSDSSYWPEVICGISECAGCDVVAIDMPGRGASDCPRGTLCPAVFCSMIQAVIEKVLPWAISRRLVLVGHSFGSAICAAAAQPGALGPGLHVNQVVFINPMGIVAMEAPHDEVIALVRAAPRPIADAFCVFISVASFYMLHLLPKVFPGMVVFEPGLEKIMQRSHRYVFQDWWQNPMGFRAFTKTLRDFPIIGEECPRLYANLSSFGASALFIVADLDERVPMGKAVDWIQKMLPQAGIHLIRVGGHDLQWERPRHLTQIVCEFLCHNDNVPTSLQMQSNMLNETVDLLQSSVGKWIDMESDVSVISDEEVDQDVETCSWSPNNSSESDQDVDNSWECSSTNC